MRKVKRSKQSRSTTSAAKSHSARTVFSSFASSFDSRNIYKLFWLNKFWPWLWILWLVDIWRRVSWCDREWRHRRLVESHNRCVQKRRPLHPKHHHHPFIIRSHLKRHSPSRSRHATVAHRQQQRRRRRLDAIAENWHELWREWQLVAAF